MNAWLTPASGALAQIVASLHATLPTLETDRLILRPCQITDWPVLEPIWTTDRAKYIGGPMGAEEAWLDFNQCVASWILRGTGPLTITLKDDDTPLGIVLLVAEYGDPSTELGWLLTADAEGKGYATEAATALRDWGFENLGRDGFGSFVDKANTASIRVATRLGGHIIGDHPAASDCHFYRYDGGAA